MALEERLKMATADLDFADLYETIDMVDKTVRRYTVKDAVKILEAVKHRLLEATRIKTEKSVAEEVETEVELSVQLQDAFEDVKFILHTHEAVTSKLLVKRRQCLRTQANTILRELCNAGKIQRVAHGSYQLAE